MSAKRAIYSIKETVLDEFNRAVPQQERSKLVESLMRRHLQFLESRLEEAARAIEADPDYSDFADAVTALTAETANRLPPHEPQ